MRLPNNELILLHLTKAKLSLCTPSRSRLVGEWNCPPLIINLGISGRWVVMFTRRPLYPRYPLDRRLGEPQSLPGHFRGKKNILPLPGIKSRFFGCPDRSPVNIPTDVLLILTKIEINKKRVAVTCECIWNFRADITNVLLTLKRRNTLMDTVKWILLRIHNKTNCAYRSVVSSLELSVTFRWWWW